MIEVWQAGRLAEARELARAESTGPFATRARLAGGEAVARTIFEGEECGTGGVEWERSGDLTERFGQRDRALLLFGAGHVGRALMLALAPLPFAVTWIDERREAFPAAVPGNVTMVATGEPAGHLAAAPDGAMVVAMTHSHARDFEIVEAALAENRFAYVGVIGSKTKRARFSSRLRKAGLAEHIVSRLICPIGVAGVASKTPASIAAGVAAQLLQFDELVKTGQKPVQMAAQEVTMVHRQRLSHGRGD